MPLTRALLLVPSLLFALCAGALQAQQITDTRPQLSGTRFGSLSDTNATFALGLLRIGDIAFRSTAYTGDLLTISGSLRPEAQHVGKPADVMAVIKVGTLFYMLNAAHQLVPWNGQVSSLVPLFPDVVLAATQELQIYSGVINGAGEYRVFMGYMPKADGELYYSGSPQIMTVATAPVPVGTCPAYGGRTVPVWHTASTGIFTHTPFAASGLSLITNGNETNDSRFSYQWVKDAVNGTPIFAPADGVLVRIRHKAENLPEFPSDDFDLFFLVSCDPLHPDKNTLVRFNHITNPRADLKATFGFGNLGAPSFNPFDEHEDRQVPLTNIAVRAGDYLGFTRGTPVAHDFDFMIAVDDVSLCPFTVLNEPFGSALLNLLGPISNSPFGPPVPGYPCAGYGGRP